MSSSSATHPSSMRAPWPSWAALFALPTPARPWLSWIVLWASTASTERRRRPAGRCSKTRPTPGDDCRLSTWTLPLSVTTATATPSISCRSTPGSGCGTGFSRSPPRLSGFSATSPAQLRPWVRGRGSRRRLGALRSVFRAFPLRNACQVRRPEAGLPRLSPAKRPAKRLSGQKAVRSEGRTQTGRWARIGDTRQKTSKSASFLGLITRIPASRSSSAAFLPRPFSL